MYVRPLYKHTSANPGKLNKSRQRPKLSCANLCTIILLIPLICYFLLQQVTTPPPPPPPLAMTTNAVNVGANETLKPLCLCNILYDRSIIRRPFVVSPCASPCSPRNPGPRERQRKGKREGAPFLPPSATIPRAAARTTY